MIFADYDARRHVRKLANNFGVDFESYVSNSLKIDLESPIALLLERQCHVRY